MISQQLKHKAMYNEQIEKLIELALADGELTEKEKQVLFKKAEAAGIDLDEFEMVLDARLYEKTQNKTPSPVAAPKSDKYGDVKKCPSCGTIVQSFSGKCSDCGYEFRDIQSDVTINKLFDALMEADNIPMDEYKESSLNKMIVNNSGKSSGIIGQQLSRSSEILAKADEQKREAEHFKRHKEKIISKKIQIISNFPVPNSKEPLLEFLTLGISKATPTKTGFIGLFTKTDADKEHNALVPAWKSKIEQVVMKAKMSLKEDKALLADIDKMVSELNSKK